MDTNTNRHKEHLAIVPPEFVKNKLTSFKLKDVNLRPLIYDCQSFSVKAPFKDYSEWIHMLKPTTLFDLKDWFGVPNEVAKKIEEKNRCIDGDGMSCAGVKKIIPTDLPEKNDWNFKSLNTDQRKAVKEMSNSLLNGYVSADFLKHPAVEAVSRYMIDAAQAIPLPLFMASDLIICSNHTAEFNHVPAMYFNNILIYGTGRLKTTSKTSIHAYQIKRVP